MHTILYSKVLLRTFRLDPNGRLNLGSILTITSQAPPFYTPSISTEMQWSVLSVLTRHTFPPPGLPSRRALTSRSRPQLHVAIEKEGAYI